MIEGKFPALNKEFFCLLRLDKNMQARDMIKRGIFIFSMTMTVFGCSSMVWHEGSMIQYSDVKSVGNNQFEIEVLGGWQHDQAALERAVMKRATAECKGGAKILSSTMGTYYSSTTGGGVTSSGNPPKINSVIECTSESL